MLTRELQTQSKFERMIKEFGLLGLVVGFLGSTFATSVIIKFILDILTGPELDVEGGIKIIAVFIKALPLCFGASLFIWVIYRMKAATAPMIALFALFLVFAAKVSNNLGIGAIAVNTNNITVISQNAIGEVLSRYRGAYGTILFLQALLVGLVIGRWAHLWSSDEQP